MSKEAYAAALPTHAPRRLGKKVLRSIEVSRAENGGHIAEHRFESGDGPYHAPEQHVFGEEEGGKLLEHVAKHLGIKHGVKDTQSAGESDEEIGKSESEE